MKRRSVSFFEVADIDNRIAIEIEKGDPYVSSNTKLPRRCERRDVSQNTTTNIVTHLDRDLRERATELLRQPQENPWDPRLADEMLHLTAKSIGVRLDPWDPALLGAVRICEPGLVEVLESAQSCVDDAYLAQNMEALGRACGGWFAACKAVWMAGRGGGR